MYQSVSMEKLNRLRRRLAIELDSVISAELGSLFDKQTERTAMAIQKEIDIRRPAKTRQTYPFQMDHLVQARLESVRAARALLPGSERNQKRQIAGSLKRLISTNQGGGILVSPAC